MEFEIYWGDLKEHKQQELLDLLGENGNYDVTPLATIFFEPEQEKSSLLRILKVEPGEVPCEKEIQNDLHSIQAEVGGGPFQPLYIGNGIVLCCNERGKLNGMVPNRWLGEDIICGPFFLVGEDDEGEFVSLTDEQLTRCREQFGEPVQFTGEEPQLELRMEFYSMW